MNHDIEKALDNLEKRAQDIQHYMNIMSKVKTVNVADDQDFQREFDFFYKVRRNAEWRKVFFEIFERKKKKNCSYKEIITELYEGTGQVEASFASKMLASIDENMPIWDSKVLDRIRIKSSNKRGQQKLEETIELYDVIVQWYSDLKANKASYNEYITSFDSRFPDYSSISDTKKIDFILWAMGEEEEDTIPSVYIQNMEALSDAAKIASRSIEAYPGVVSAVKQIADCMKQYQGISQTFMENARRISETIRPIFEYQQQIMESVRPALESLGKTIAAITATIPKIEIPESFFKTLGNKILEKANAHVGYRVRDEIVFYMLNNKNAGNLLTRNQAFDHEIMQKILPRIQGSSASVKIMLCELFKYCAGDYESYQTESDDVSAKMMAAANKETCKYKESTKKIAFMVRRFEEDGFTAYWL